ncbi:MAG: hypothetical protein H0V89_03340 [Deltaproteobacteria bacterium]|nr:hypothetical protein [Deltaproteobacteria bacterium]
MTRLLSLAALLAVAACGNPVGKMCDDLTKATEACVDDVGGTETDATDACETQYENCTDEDIALLNAAAACLLADCEDLTCRDGYDELSAECLNLPATGDPQGE